MSFVLHCGNSLDVLKTLGDNSIDSIVTDPPYELAFMGKSWDASGIAYNVDLWKECLRVLKPGGHLLSFGGSRTYHRMTCAIEDAGFEIRDQIMWLYGSGFPKSMDVSKSIDKHFGKYDERPVVGMKNSTYDNANRNSSKHKSPSELSSFGKWGLKFTPHGLPMTDAVTDDAKEWQGWGTALKPAHEPICVARKPLIGTVAENVLTHRTGAINIDGCRVGTEPVVVNKLESWSGFGQEIRPEYSSSINTSGRWPANVIHDGSDEVISEFPQSQGAFAPVKSGHSGKSRGIYGDYAQRGDDGLTFYADSGSAARFFYSAKVSKKERDAGLDGLSDDTVERKNIHPTVKPIALMRYLCKLVTPPGGTVLDPFNGSGSTGIGAVLEGFSYIGIDLSEEYIEISRARIIHWSKSQPNVKEVQVKSVPATKSSNTNRPTTTLEDFFEF